MTYGKGSAYAAAGIEIATLRAAGSVGIKRPLLDCEGGATRANSQVGEREAWFKAAGGFIKTAIHAGERLHSGQQIDGPAIIQRFADTVVLPPGALAQVDSMGGIRLTFRREA